MKKLFPVGLQVAGGAAALAGVYVLAGLGVTLVIGGAVVLLVGMLRESGRV